MSIVFVRSSEQSIFKGTGWSHVGWLGVGAVGRGVGGSGAGVGEGYVERFMWGGFVGNVGRGGRWVKRACNIEIIEVISTPQI